jgi:hypothetical protein
MGGRVKRQILLVLALVLLTGSTASAGPVIVAVGDISPRKHPGASAQTAALVQQIGPVKVLTLGDAQYGNGTYEEYLAGYDNTWGMHRSITAPVPGEHDYRTIGASGYKEYFADLATPQGPTYYAYKINRWGLIALDSNIPRERDSEQDQWLFDQVVRWHDRPCILAYYHHPRYSSGLHGSYPSVQPFWDWLSVGGTDVVLSAHDRDYERFARLNGDGRHVPYGIRQFVVGTGGKSHTPFGETEGHSQVRVEGRYGVLAIELRHKGYRWEFIAVNGEVLDFGAQRCT